MSYIHIVSFDYDLRTRPLHVKMGACASKKNKGNPKVWKVCHSGGQRGKARKPNIRFLFKLLSHLISPSKLVPYSSFQNHLPFAASWKAGSITGQSTEPTGDVSQNERPAFFASRRASHIVQ